MVVLNDGDGRAVTVRENNNNVDGGAREQRWRNDEIYDGGGLYSVIVRTINMHIPAKGAIDTAYVVIQFDTPVTIDLKTKTQIYNVINNNKSLHYLTRYALRLFSFLRTWDFQLLTTSEPQQSKVGFRQAKRKTINLSYVCCKQFQSRSRVLN
ncbi:hypothetical protein L1887_22978 [Cichorium endivia]|nr:hypothetical protein L1887_22978 [Cichorium endivia]